MHMYIRMLQSSSLEKTVLAACSRVSVCLRVHDCMTLNGIEAKQTQSLVFQLKYTCVVRLAHALIVLDVQSEDGHVPQRLWIFREKSSSDWSGERFGYI